MSEADESDVQRSDVQTGARSDVQPVNLHSRRVALHKLQRRVPQRWKRALGRDDAQLRRALRRSLGKGV